MMIMGDVWPQLGSSIATFMLIWSLYRNYFPPQLKIYIFTYAQKVYCFFYPYIHITFHEFEGDGSFASLFDRNKVFVAIERYLGNNSSENAKRLVAKGVKDSSQPVILSMDDHEEVVEEYKGIKVWWSSNQNPPRGQTISYFPREDEKRYFQLKFHRKNRDIITRSYLKHVLDEGEAMAVRERKRKLYTNNKSDHWHGWRSTKWSHVIFKHPSTFKTLAMEPTRKQEIMDELLNFSKSKDYYTKIGKAWKRGYLLYGPPGTGKSSMIVAMANLLNYDVYDLELTAVKDNSDLRKLLIETSDKSIIVIEDIDCSLDLTGQREKKEEEKDKEKEEKDPIKKDLLKEIEKKKGSEVTLSGLLNVIDGLWSAIGEERIIVFTTNYPEKLDPALVRRGRMDNRIELSYCCFEAFKVLVNNYLDVESHQLFPEIKRLLGETKITPADVAESLMPKSAREEADTCLKRLIKSLEAAKEEARLKAEEEERIKAAKEEEDRKKKQAAEDNKKAESSVTENGNVKENGNAKENGNTKNDN
ncbi:PREDICTED: AAA-ATPase ASD, mitochondrial-like [Ipomoea nil]|uniref:AAA-ATPase ASD, mitochondrial-like n=1 Tax=Ipomoea nil TaxID=35883 RepID=UPI000901B324|nr:PREDICTED: AAA-ATPase ASD, mitochondrial-like [Ipomoea nil]